TIIVYAGAIVVTFLFVIMLAQQEGLSSADQRSREPFVATLAGFVLLGALLVVLQRNYDRTDLDRALDRLAGAPAADSFVEIQAILGDFGEFQRELRDKVPKQRFQETSDPLINAQWKFWDALDDASVDLKRLPALKRDLARAHEAGLKIRAL